MPRLTLAALALLLSCSSGKSDEDLAALRNEVADLRSEVADVRRDLATVIETVRQVRDASGGAPAAASAAPDAGPTAAKAAPAAPPVAAAAPPKPGKPPAQGSVNIQVESNPAGATVFVADKKVGVTPVIIKSPVGTGEINVRLEKSGYRPRLMTLRPDEDTKISVQLAKKSE